MKLNTLLLFLLCFILFCSCSENEVSFDDPMGTYEGELVNVIDNGNVNNYTVIRSENASAAITSLSIKLRQELSARYNCDFPIDTDYIGRNETVPVDTFEILVGETNRSESLNSAKKLGFDDFVIDFYDNRIVILGGSDSATEKAVEYFLEKFCSDSQTLTLQVPKTLSLISRQDYAIDSITLLGKKASDFNIIFDTKNEELYNAARLFNDNFKILAGMSMGYLDIEGEYTSPAVIITVDANKPSAAYNVYTKDGNIYIEAGSELGFVYASTAIFTDTFGANDASGENNVKIDTLSLSDDGYKNGVFPLGYTLFNMDDAALVIGYTGQVEGIYDIRDGKNYIDFGKESPFAVLTSGDTSIGSSNFSATENTCSVNIGDRTVSFDIIHDDKFVAFKLVNALEDENSVLRFMNANITSEPESDDDFAITNYSMAYYLNPTIFPDGKSETIGMEAHSKFETEGAVGALIAGPKSSHRDIIKSANQYIEEGKAPLSDKGGANALDYSGNFGNYMIVGDSEASMVEDWIDLCTKYDIDQLDFHMGENTFLTGSMTFTKYSSAEEFKENVSAPLKEAGILSGLHTYAFYIDPKDTTILTDPKWQQQLEFIGEFTLAADMAKSGMGFTVNESAEEITAVRSAVTHASKYFLIDEEIVKMSTISGNKFVVERGACGTTAAEHKAGAAVKNIGAVFGMLAPDIDSELFLQIARNTAEAYNKGGFDMIYVDALDGITRHAAPNEQWYYMAKFANEIFKYCQTDPLIEYSSMPASLWISRGRGGAWDHPRRAYKLGVDLHIKNNLPMADYHYTTTLGWYDLYPTSTYPGNTNVEYYFFDDVDYVGAKSLAYDMSFAYQGIEKLQTHPAYVGNMERYALYSDLRKSNYFSEEIKEQIREGEYEYALLEKSEGEYVFVEKDYTETKLYNVKDPERNIITAENPFDTAQVPFIRIEGRYSTEGEDPITLIDLSSQTDLSNVKSVNFDKEIGILSNTALKVNVLGNNSNDAICFRLNCADNSIIDFIIKLDFEGWREFVLAEPDNGTFEDLNFNASYPFYPYCRGIFNYNRVTSITVMRTGVCAGAKMTSLTACKYLENGITNPSVTIDGKTITFEGTIASDEYLEYFPGDDSATIYDGNGNRREAKITGELHEIAKGEFTARLNGTAENENAPLRATVTFGFTGEELK